MGWYNIELHEVAEGNIELHNPFYRAKRLFYGFARDRLDFTVSNGDMVF